MRGRQRKGNEEGGRERDGGRETQDGEGAGGRLAQATGGPS